jgi:hypothetical protein
MWNNLRKLWIAEWEGGKHHVMIWNQVKVNRDKIESTKFFLSFLKEGDGWEKRWSREFDKTKTLWPRARVYKRCTKKICTPYVHPGVQACTHFHLTPSMYTLCTPKKDESVCVYKQREAKLFNNRIGSCCIWPRPGKIVRETRDRALYV